MAVDQRTTVAAYERLCLAEPARRWELHDGHMVEKPAVTIGHSFVVGTLMRLLLPQLDPVRYRMSVNFTRLRRPNATYYVPGLVVIPVAFDAAKLRPWGDLEVYEAPLPLVVEVWSPSTGGYDVDAKVPDYQARGDEEIWRLHPFERMLTVWRRRADGGYDETVHRSGVVEVGSLPGVSIDLDVLFDA